MLLHSNVILKRTNLQTCPVSTCQLYELARQSRLQNFLKGEMFLKHYFVINDFWDIVFFKKRFIPHMEGFFFSIRALSSSYFNLEFLKTGHEWMLGVNIFWNCSFIHWVSKNISIYADKLWFSSGSWTHIQLCSYMYNQTAWMTLWLGLCTLL